MRPALGARVVPLLPNQRDQRQRLPRLRAHAMAITRCLVVDDDPELLQSVCDYLRRFGLEAVPAATAAQMRACLSQGSIDVVILDVMLPMATAWPSAPRCASGPRRPTRQ